MANSNPRTEDEKDDRIRIGNDTSRDKIATDSRRSNVGTERRSGQENGSTSGSSVGGSSAGTDAGGKSGTSASSPAGTNASGQAGTPAGGSASTASGGSATGAAGSNSGANASNGTHASAGRGTNAGGTQRGTSPGSRETSTGSGQGQSAQTSAAKANQAKKSIDRKENAVNVKNTANKVKEGVKVNAPKVVKPVKKTASGAAKVAALNQHRQTISHAAHAVTAGSGENSTAAAMEAGLKADTDLAKETALKTAKAVKNTPKNAKKVVSGTKKAVRGTKKVVKVTKKAGKSVKKVGKKAVSAVKKGGTDVKNLKKGSKVTSVSKNKRKLSGAAKKRAKKATFLKKRQVAKLRASSGKLGGVKKAGETLVQVFAKFFRSGGSGLMAFLAAVGAVAAVIVFVLMLVSAILANNEETENATSTNLLEGDMRITYDRMSGFGMSDDEIVAWIGLGWMRSNYESVSSKQRSWYRRTGRYLEAADETGATLYDGLTEWLDGRSDDYGLKEDSGTWGIWGFKGSVRNRFFRYVEDKEFLNTIYGVTPGTNTVMIGDSRYVGTYVAVTGNRGQAGYVNDTVDDITWIAGGGEGFSWLKDSAAPSAASHIQSGTNIVINLGCNNTSGLSGKNAAMEYINYLKEKKSGDWKNANIYFVAVYPVNASSLVSNSYLTEFNDTIRSNIAGIGSFIDVNTIMLNYVTDMTTDGTHFHSDAYRAGYAATLEYLNRNASVDAEETEAFEDMSPWELITNVDVQTQFVIDHVMAGEKVGWTYDNWLSTFQSDGDWMENCRILTCAWAIGNTTEDDLLYEDNKKEKCKAYGADGNDDGEGSYGGEGTWPFRSMFNNAREAYIAILGGTNYSYGGSGNNITQFAAEIANNDKYIYWWGGGHNMAGEPTQIPDDFEGGGYLGLDCSGFVSYVLNHCGYDVGTFSSSNEGTMLTAKGFTEYDYDEVKDSLVPGDVLWMSGHTEIYYGDGQQVGAHQSSREEGVYRQNDTSFGFGINKNVSLADSLSISALYSSSWQKVYRPPGLTSVSSTGSNEVTEFAASIANNDQYLYRLGAGHNESGEPMFNGTYYYFDCSSFVRYVFNNCGFDLPNFVTATEEKTLLEAGFTKLNLSEIGMEGLQPGDVLWTDYHSGTGSGHTGIYYGNGQQVHASSDERPLADNVLIEGYADYWMEAYRAPGIASSNAPATGKELAASAQTLYVKAKFGYYSYGNSETVPACDDGIISNISAISRILYDNGYTDQPDGAISMDNIISYLEGKSFSKKEDIKEIRKGSIILLKTGSGTAGEEGYDYVVMADSQAKERKVLGGYTLKAYNVNSSTSIRTTMMPSTIVIDSNTEFVVLNPPSINQLFKPNGSSNGYTITPTDRVGEIIPDEVIGGVCTYEAWNRAPEMSSWADGTSQKTLNDRYQHFDTEGFGTIGDRYVIACTYTFGQVGDAVDFYLENGTVVKIIIGDIKSQNDATCNKWGHDYGDQVMEFMVDKSIWYDNYNGSAGAHKNPGNSGCHPEFGSHVVKAVNLGTILG